MGFERNDVVFKNRLREALNEENNMGFEHNDIVTTDVMNKAIAEGGGGGAAGLVVGTTLSANILTCDKTWQEIHDAMASGKTAFVIMPDDVGETSLNAGAVELVSEAFHDGMYFVTSKNCGFEVASADGYPAVEC